MKSAKYFIGDKVKTPDGVGTVTALRFSRRNRKTHFVMGDGFAKYFNVNEIEPLSVRAEHAETPPKIPCEKVKYHTYALAQKRLIEIMGRSLRTKKPIRAYKCPHCGLWHLTSKPLPGVELKQTP